jgi:hypothetical protein
MLVRTKTGTAALRGGHAERNALCVRIEIDCCDESDRIRLSYCNPLQSIREQTS